MENLSTSEQKLLLLIRNLKPFERIVIEADKNGEPETYMVTTSVRVILRTDTVTPARIHSKDTL